MNALKYTPGPWWAGNLIEPDMLKKEAAQKEIQIHTTKETLFIGSISTLNVSEQEATDNAKLISAAPNMYEAIQYTITALADSGGMVDFGELVANVDKARKRLQMAIKPLL